MATVADIQDQGEDGYQKIENLRSCVYLYPLWAMEALDFRCDLAPLNEGEIHFISSDMAQSYFEAFATRLVRHALDEGMANRKNIRASEYMRLKELLEQQYVIQEIYKIEDRTVIVSYILRWFIKQKPDFDQCIIGLCEEQDWDD